MYNGLRGRLAAKRWKTGEKAGTIRREKIATPYTLEEFRAWLRVTLEDEPFCPYCKERVDIMTISPDHAIPVSRGGSLERKNLRGPCAKCNRRKGKLKPGEYKFILDCIATLPDVARQDILHRLGGGMKFLGNKKPSAPAEVKMPENVMAVPSALVKK